MKNTAIIIPTRLGAKRFPNKPLAKINNVPMIIHVLQKAKESNVGEVFVATPDKKIFDIVKDNGGIAIMTQNNHLSGSDRIYEVYSKKLKNNVDLIINLQGDMPNIDPNTISKLEKLMRDNQCDIGTLASPIKDNNEIVDENVVKVKVDETLKEHSFLKAKESKVGEVFVATPDKKIFDIVNNNGGIAILTQQSHPSGSDRIYEVYSKKLKNNVDLIINLQGDMPNIDPNTISKLEKLMRDNQCDIGTLASPIKDNNEIVDENVVKVKVDEILKEHNFLKAKDFFC